VSEKEEEREHSLHNLLNNILYLNFIYFIPSVLSVCTQVRASFLLLLPFCVYLIMSTTHCCNFSYNSFLTCQQMQSKVSQIAIYFVYIML